MLLPGWKIEIDGVTESEIYYGQTSVGETVTLLQNQDRFKDAYGSHSIGIWAVRDVVGKDSNPVSISLTGR